MTEQLDDRLEDLVKQLSPQSSTTKLPALRPGFRLPNVLLASAKMETTTWLKGRHNYYNPMSKGLADLLHALFESLDLDSVGRADGLTVVEQLISLGLASEPAVLITVISI